MSLTSVQSHPADVSEFDTKVVAARYGDLRAYAKAVHNLEIEQHQEAWEEALETGNELVIICPPDTYKSTTVRMWCEKKIGQNPNIRILWLQKAGEQAERNVMAMQRTIESNPVYRAAFGIQRDPDGQWTKTTLFVLRDSHNPDPTILGCGLNGPYQGSHFDIVVIDDPTNQEDVTSDTTMEQQRSKLRGVIIDRAVEGGRIVGIMTRWGENDLVPTFADMGFAIYEMPIAGDYPWGPTISAKLFPQEKLEALRRKKGDRLFALTYMCNTQATEGNRIKREHISYWDASTIPNRPLAFYMAVDPAASLKTSADYAAICTVGVDIKPNPSVIYLVDMFAARLETPDLELEIVKRAKRVNGLRKVGLETVGFQLSLIQGMKRRYKLPLEEIQYRTKETMRQRIKALDRDKVSRADYLDSLFASNRLFLPKGLPLLDGVSLETELCLVPYGRHDDRMDALAMACCLAESARPQPQRRVRSLWGGY